MNRLVSLLTLAPVLVGCGPAGLNRDTAGEIAPTVIPAFPESHDGFHPVGPPRPAVLFGQDRTAEEAFESLGVSVGRPVLVHWTDLKKAGYAKDEPVPSELIERDLRAALEQMTAQASRSPAPMEGSSLDYRVAGGILEVASRSYFDNRERCLVCYDVRGALEALQRLDFEQADSEAKQRGDPGIVVRTSEEFAKEVKDAITQSVETDAWAENGGDLGALWLIDGRLFITAPPRLHSLVFDRLLEFPGDPPVYVVGNPIPQSRPAAVPGYGISTCTVLWGIG